MRVCVAGVPYAVILGSKTIGCLVLSRCRSFFMRFGVWSRLSLCGVVMFGLNLFGSSSSRRSHIIRHAGIVRHGGFLNLMAVKSIASPTVLISWWFLRHLDAFLFHR